MSLAFVHIQNLNLKYPRNWVLQGLDWTIKNDENWVLGGISGSGKTGLAKLIAHRDTSSQEIRVNFKHNSTLPSKILFVESWYQFKNVEGVANFYYQQRYTSQQAKETVTVKKELELFGSESQLNHSDKDKIVSALGFTALLDTQLLALSSGEHKKLQLVKALWLKPQLLILDQPYSGLDNASRNSLNKLIDQACADGMQLILISNDPEMPACINRFAEIKEGKLVTLQTAYQPSSKVYNQTFDIPQSLKVRPSYSSESIVKMIDVNISYGEKQVLKNINWEVKAGDKWALQGPNGSGKSTLLSLINGDHPQSYANTLYLFGKKRGSGESIWDIKKHIGLISPEFHWYFDASATVWQSIASGLYDSVGLFNQLPYSKTLLVNEMLVYFGLDEDKHALLNTLPLGKQRLVLLARTIIKNPELLILDEPCQGLDHHQIQHFNQLIDALCNNGMTLIYVGHVDSHLPSCLDKKLLLENGKVKSIENMDIKKLKTNICDSLVEQI